MFLQRAAAKGQLRISRRGKAQDCTEWGFTKGKKRKSMQDKQMDREDDGMEEGMGEEEEEMEED